MSSGFPTSEPRSCSRPVGNGAHFYVPPTEDAAQTQEAVDTHSTPLVLRFNNLTLDELSEELDRRTRKTQRLQEEVEHATRKTLESFGCFYGNNSPGQSWGNYASSEDSTTLSTHQQAGTQPLGCSPDALNKQAAQKDRRSSEKEVFKNTVESCLYQMSDLNLNQIHNQPEQDVFNPQRVILNLQKELHEVQVEKDVQSDLRLKDSKEQVSQMETMLCMLQELQSIKRCTDQKRQETENEALALHRKVETLEETVKGMYNALWEGQPGQNSNTQGVNRKTHQSLMNINEDLNIDAHKLQDRLFSSKGSLGSGEHNGINKQDRMEDVIASLGQEVAALTDNLSSSKDISGSLCVKLQLLKKLSERHTSLHWCQIRKLESDLSSYKVKVCCVEQQLWEAQTKLSNIQREKEQSLQSTQELHYQLERLKRCGLQQQLKLQEETDFLKGQLEMARNQLCQTVEEKTSLQALLEQRAQEKRKSQQLLREKEEELHLKQGEAQQNGTRLEEAQGQCQSLQAEQETLRQKLSEREKMLDALKLQMESSIQTSVQHSNTIDSLKHENGLLINQLKQHKLETKQLRADLAQHKSELAAAEHKRQQLQASVTEQNQRVQEETLEKRQVTTLLELQRMQLLTLTKEHKELQLLHSCKNDEHEGVVMELQSQLRSAHEELDKIRHSLRKFQGADRHGLKVASDMQKEITARREEVDSLQSKIQHLGDNMEKLLQEKRFQNTEAQQQFQELIVIKEERRHLKDELTILRSKDQQLCERISELEAILHKLTESFASCQDFIQLKEQQYFRLKIQQALHLKELPGQTLCTAATEPPPVPDSPTPSAHILPASSQHTSNIKRQQDSCAGELRSLVKELRGVLSQNHRPHTDKSGTDSGFCRRRSAPGRETRATIRTDSHGEAKANSRLRRKTCGSEPRLLRTAEPNGTTINKSHFMASPAPYASFSPLRSEGRRSPVHSLLTSDPNS
ncbi:coiled-coil domain-containing protein 158-like isoform 1-T2 [Menidia menidia]